jgi:hypothetical protein
METTTLAPGVVHRSTTCRESWWLLSTQADLAEFDKRSIALERIARYDVMVSSVKDEGAMDGQVRLR